MAMYILADRTTIFFTRVFSKEDGSTFAASVVEIFGGTLSGRHVIVTDHPPTEGLIALIKGFQSAGAQVYLFAHHNDEDPQGGVIVAECQEILRDHAIMTTRQECPTCVILVRRGEFSGDIIVTDIDPDGILAGLKGAGLPLYSDMQNDGTAFDNPLIEKTNQEISPMGKDLFNAWQSVGMLGKNNYEGVFAEVVRAFVLMLHNKEEGGVTLRQLAIEHENRIARSKKLIKEQSKLLSPKVRFITIPKGSRFDPETLTMGLNHGVVVGGREISTGPIAYKFGKQISLVSGKDDKNTIDLGQLVEQTFGSTDNWNPKGGIIIQSPSVVHLSPQKWEIFRPVLLRAFENEKLLSD